MQKENTVRIVAAVLDTENLKLYKPDGDTILIPQGDSRLRVILDVATPDILRQGYADINLGAPENPYQKFEEKSSGVVRLFRVAKDKLKNLFSGPAANDAVLEPRSVGTVPTAPTPASESADQAKEEKLKAAVADILKHAVPVASPNFNEDTVAKQAKVVEEDGKTPNVTPEQNTTDTIVAVVDGKIIPGMEKIKSQFARATKLGSTVGVERFLERISKVIDKRKHSIEDLLKFLERGDLPIAEDGSILIYKVLEKRDGKFVDCHTKRVTQQVGSYVCMDESLVDPNRRNECSNGLHVARRGYVSGFPGDVCVLAKLAPEDVIAVPEYDANKMRVCGYHIIFELTKEMFSTLKANKPITDTEAGRKLLARAMAGDHIGIIEEVRINGHKGTNVVITPKGTAHKAEAQPVSQVSQPPVAAVEVETATALTNEEGGALDAPVNPKALSQEVAQLSRKDMAKGLHETYERATDPAEKATALQALLDFKKSCKVGWDKLGIPDPQGNTKQATAPAKKAPEKAAKPQLASTKPKDKPMTPREEIQHLLPRFNAATGQTKVELAQDILKVKQAAKKSWDVLGVPADVVEKIKLRTKD